MKQLFVSSLFLLGTLLSCSKQAELVTVQSSAPATLQDAVEFAKKYDVTFKPDDNFNQDKKVSKADLEQLFVKWSKRQASIMSPQQKAISRAYDAFYADVKMVKSRQEYYNVLDKHPKVKDDLITQMGGINRFNQVKTESLSSSVAK